MGLLWNALHWFNYHNIPNCMEESGCVFFFPPLFSNSHRTLLLEHHILLECPMKNKWQYQALARMWSSWDSPTLLVKMESGAVTPENSIAAYKVKHIVTTWPSNPTPRIYQTEWKFDKWNPCTKQGLLGTRRWEEAMTMKKLRRIFRGDRTLFCLHQ